MKSILTTVICCLAMLTATAQEGLRLGVLTNYNLTFIINQNTYGSPELEYSAKFGPGIGAQVNYNVTPNFGFVVEALYTQQGQKYEETKNGVHSYRDVDLRYLNFPVMLKYNSSEGFSRFFVMAGLQYSNLTAASIEHTKNGVEQSDNLADALERFERHDIRFVSGLGTELWFGNTFYVSAGLRFNLGFSDINDEDWRIPRPGTEYAPSRNAFGGIVLGGHIRL